MVGEKELVGLLRDTEGFLGLASRLAHLDLLAHVVLLSLLGHLTVIVALSWVWLIESVDDELALIVDRAQLTASALLRLGEADVFCNWHAVFRDQVVPVVLPGSSAVLDLLLPVLELLSGRPCVSGVLTAGLHVFHLLPVLELSLAESLLVWRSLS